MGLESFYVAYSSVALMGLFHGSDPTHGWPLSVLHALRSGGGAPKALLLTLVLALGHFLSTIAVIAAAWLLGEALAAYLLYIQLAAGLLLLLLGLNGLREAFLGSGEHGHEEPSSYSVLGLFKYSLLLGFAHEEEVALAAIVLLGVNPIVLSLLYLACVYAAMSLWTLVSLYFTRKASIGKRFYARLHYFTSLMLVFVGSYVIAEALGLL